MDPLLQALQATGDDLKANRDGRIGPFQAVRIRRTLIRWLAIGGVILFFGIIGAAALLYLGDANNSRSLTVTGMLLTVFNAIVMGLALQFWLRTRADLARPVEVHQGAVHRTVRASKNGRFLGYVVRLDGVPGELRVNKQVFNAFTEGVTYRLYRAAGSRTLLSGETIQTGG